MERVINIYLYIGIFFTLGSADEYSFRKAKTRLDLVDHSLVLWSGAAKSLAWCSSQCTRDPKCVSLLYNKTDKSCKTFNFLHQLDESAEETDTEYYLIERSSNQKLPESCADVAECSGASTNGEYWLYPKATSGRRVKVYCHNMGTNPTEYITLKYTNAFVQHTKFNLLISLTPCLTDYKPPLKKANFAKIGINIQDMTVNGIDYTFATLTGDFQLPYGTTTDCNVEDYRSNCHYFGDAVINTRGTGVILDQNIIFGPSGYQTVMHNFQRSTDGTEISFQCAGWCGTCGPTTVSIKLVLSSEIVAKAEAIYVVCIVR